MKGRHWLFPALTGFILVTLLSACSLQPEQGSHTTLEVETIDSTDYAFGPVQVIQEGKGLQVKGSITHGIGGPRDIPGAIHIEVYSQEGQLLAETDTHPMPIHRQARPAQFGLWVPVRINRQARTAQFDTWLPVEPGLGDRVHVSHRL
ncbi:hypothetical protein [Ectothiorhodospira marina]|uniref:Uncharacterized protein n=1 Tax=Ectothiorhodospira marina TaxID=1396821 RepID=A0A1H7G6L0_9GAMM|nr:hypothetical protein [Ectothiorhodospira marina]SEK33923.1 hypothetical protein SAMN05444515_101454 [Ectothiorhodospira marina]